jgi:CRISPR-associated protein Csx14
MDFIRQTTLMATMGGQPQVVTFALDELLSRGVEITQLFLIHFASDAPRLRQAMQKVVAEIEGPRYANRSLRLTLFPVATDAGSLSDIRDEADAHLAWEAINQLIIELKEARHTLHVCISGGRRMLGLMTISVAMLHFGHQDVLWHMYTPDEWMPHSRDGMMMHLPPHSGFKLIQVPMMPWGSYFPALRQLTRPVLNEPDVLAAPRRVLDYAEEARKTAVLKRLTERQREVLQAFAQGLMPQQVADRLFITVKTVDSHKTVILGECRNAWNLPGDTWLDYRFLADKFEAFAG